MKAAEMKGFKVALEALRARLRGDVSTMADAALRKTRAEASGDLSSMPIHMADIGSDAYEQEFTLSLMASEEGTLELVEPVLQGGREFIVGDAGTGQGAACAKGARRDGTVTRERPVTEQREELEVLVREDHRGHPQAAADADLVRQVRVRIAIKPAQVDHG